MARESHLLVLARQAVALARLAFTPLALVFLGWALYSQREALGDVLGGAHLGALALLVLAWTLLHFLSPLAAFFCLKDTTNAPTYGELLRLHLVRLPARYLPGGIWHTVVRVAELDRRGSPRTGLAWMVALENLVPLCTSVAIGTSFLWASGALARAPAAALLVASIALVAGIPALLRKLVPGSHSLTASRYASVVGASLLFWTAASATFAGYLSSLPGLASFDPVEAAGAYLLAWAAGFAALFAPQGLGVFESTAAYLLRGGPTFALMLAVAAGFRVIVLGGDVMGYFAGLALQARGRRAH